MKVRRLKLGCLFLFQPVMDQKLILATAATRMNTNHVFIWGNDIMNIRTQCQIHLFWKHYQNCLVGCITDGFCYRSLIITQLLFIEQFISLGLEEKRQKKKIEWFWRGNSWHSARYWVRAARFTPEKCSFSSELGFFF